MSMQQSKKSKHKVQLAENREFVCFCFTETQSHGQFYLSVRLLTCLRFSCNVLKLYFKEIFCRCLDKVEDMKEAATMV